MSFDLLGRSQLQNPGVVRQRSIQRVIADVPSLNNTQGPIRFALSPLNYDLSTFRVVTQLNILNDTASPSQTATFASLHATSVFSRVVLNISGRTVVDLQGINLLRSAWFKAFASSSAQSSMDIYESTTWGGAATNSARIAYDQAATGGPTVVYRPLENAFSSTLLPLSLVNGSGELLLYLAQPSEALNGSALTPASIGFSVNNATLVYDSLVLDQGYETQLRQRMATSGLDVLFKSEVQFTSTFSSSTYSQQAPVQTASLRQIYCVLRNSSNLGIANSETLSTYINPLTQVQLNLNGVLFPAQPLICNQSPAVDPFFEVARCQHLLSAEPGLEENAMLCSASAGYIPNATTYTNAGGGFLIALDVSRQVSDKVVSGISTLQSAQPVIVNYTLASTPSSAVRSDVFCVTDRILRFRNGGTFEILA